MAYKIGTVTLSASWNLSGSMHTAQGTDVDYNSSSAGASFQGGIGGYGASVAVDAVGFDPASPANQDLTATNVSVIANTTNGTGCSLSYQQLTDIDLTGGISVSIPCDIVWEYVSVSSNPFFDRIVDSPLYLKRRYYLVGNGDASMSASFCGCSDTSTMNVRGVEVDPSITQSAVGRSSHAIGPFYGPGDSYPHAILSAEASCSAASGLTTNIPAGAVTSSSASSTFTEVVSGSAGYPGFSVNTSGSANASAGGCSASTSNSAVGSASTSFTAPRNWSLSGVIRAMESPYPDTLTLACARYAGDPSPEFTATDSFSRSGAQTRYQTMASATTGGIDTVDSHVMNTFTDVSVSILPLSLSAIGDEPLAHRVMFRGESDVPGLTIAQAASFVIDDMGGTLSVTGPAALTRTYSTAKSFSTYRYLRVRLRSVGSANQAAKINIEGFAWNLTTGADGVYVERDIDLCSPDSVTTAALNDTWDTRWPIPTGASVTSGPFRVSSVTFNNIVSGSIVEFDSLTLVRVNPPTIDFLPTLYPSRYRIPPAPADPVMEPEWPDVAIQNVERSIGTGGDGTSNDWVRRFLLANSDGRQTVEETDFWYTRSVNAVSGITVYSFNMPSLSGLAAQINDNGDLPFYAPWNLGTDPAGGEARWPGWAATPVLPAPAAFVPTFTGESPPANPYFYNADVQQASFLFGGGALYQSGWTYGFDRPAGVISSQPLFDIIELCGMAGDVFGHGGGGSGNCTLVAAAILRAQSHGLTFDSATGDPVAAQTVELRQSPLVVGTGTSRADGWYHTAGISALPPGAGIAVRPVGGDLLSLGIPYTRHRHRAAFIVTPEVVTQWLSSDVSDALRLLRAVLKTGKLRLESWGGDSTWGGEDSTIPCIHPTIRFRHKDAANTLVVASETTGATPHSIQRRTTTDEGRTFSAMTTVFTEGYFPAFCTAPTGLEYHYSLTTNADSTAAIQGRILGGQGQTVVATFTAVLASVGIKADMIAAAWRNGVIILLYRKASDNSIVTLRSADGKVFA